MKNIAFMDLHVSAKDAEVCRTWCLENTIFIEKNGVVPVASVNKTGSCFFPVEPGKRYYTSVLKIFMASPSSGDAAHDAVLGMTDELSENAKVKKIRFMREFDFDGANSPYPDSCRYYKLFVDVPEDESCRYLVIPSNSPTRLFEDCCEIKQNILEKITWRAGIQRPFLGLNDNNAPDIATGDFIPVFPGQEYAIEIDFGQNRDPACQPSVSGYDENKKPVTILSWMNDQNESNRIVIPSNTRYIRVSACLSSFFPSMVLTKDERLDRAPKYSGPNDQVYFVFNTGYRKRILSPYHNFTPKAAPVRCELHTHLIDNGFPYSSTGMQYMARYVDAFAAVDYSSCGNGKKPEPPEHVDAPDALVFLGYGAENHNSPYRWFSMWGKGVENLPFIEASTTEPLTSLNEWIDLYALKHEMIVSINSPSWAKHVDQPETLAAAIEGAALIEVFNGYSYDYNFHPQTPDSPDAGVHYGENFWDAALTSGKKIFGTAVSDLHDAWPVSNGWIDVYPAAYTAGAVWNAILNGCFVAKSKSDAWETYTDNYHILDLDTSNGEYYVKTESPCDIVFISDGGTIVQNNPGLTEARYKLTGEEIYVRCELRHAIPGNEYIKAWLQPVFILPGQKRIYEK
ncbi:MAG: hypothetical protein LBF95_05885 [Treponema sp.]|jgi:hypothetical protein|nr:hypothetical protein [Treponema sp.]